MSVIETVPSTATLQLVNRRSVASPVPKVPVRPQSNAGLPSRIAVVGNYLPRQCGIATFTTDLCDAISTECGAARLFAVPVNDTESGYAYPARVRLALAQDDLSSYEQAADFLNFTNFDLVCLQHEYGIFGGPAGQSHSGSASATQDARHHHAAYGSSRTESRPATSDGGDRRAIGSSHRDERAFFPVPAGNIQSARQQDRHGCRTAFPTCHSWIPISTKTASAWKEKRYYSRSACSRRTRESKM